MHRRLFLLASLAAVGVLAVGGGIYRAFSRDITREQARIGSGSDLFQSRFGTTEYAVAGPGDGPPVIMIHGTGGGFDQGLSMSGPLIAAGHWVIAPSRFGYLRTDFPQDPSSENQADAIVDLMDHLGIDRAPVIGVSAGALSAIQVAIRHPDRCAALIALVPATFVPDRAPPRPDALGAAIMEYALQSDFLFWAGIKTAEDTMIQTLLATDPALVHQASLAEQERARTVLQQILPISARSQGLLNDARLAGTPAEMDLVAIEAPTLAISLEDDGFKTFEAAHHIAQSVPGAKFVSYPTGGHVFVGHEAEVFREIEAFLAGLPGT